MFITQDLRNNTPHEGPSKEIRISELPDYVKFFIALSNDFPQIARSINWLDPMDLVYTRNENVVLVNENGLSFFLYTERNY